MATGDASDIAARIRAVLPAGWFSDTTPVLGGILAGLASAWSSIYAMVAYAQAQARIATATDTFLDMISADFFGMTLPRLTNESDAAFSSRIRASLFAPRVTRAAMISALTTLTGRAPAVFEPANAGDTGGIAAAGSAAWTGVAIAGASASGYGGLGSLQLPFQAFITAYRPLSGGIANIMGLYYGAGWIGGGLNGAGNSGGAISIASLSSVGGVTDAAIQNTVSATRPAGTIMWMRISS